MAYQWFDDFSRYGSGSAGRTAMLDGLVYSVLDSGSQPSADPDPNVVNGLCWKVDSTSSWWNSNHVSLPSPVSGKIGVHFRMWLTALPDNAVAAPCDWRTVGNSGLCSLKIQINGSIKVYSGGGDQPSTQIGDTIVPVISPRTWNHVEAWYDSSDGTGELWINGIKKLEFTGGTTGTTAILNHSQSGVNGAQSTMTMYFKDYGIWDSTGTENNTVAGTVIVSRRKPNADVTLGGWLPSTGSTGYNLLAKDAVDDATYLSADDTPPAAMQYTFTDIDPDVTSIRAIMSVARMRKTDGGDGNVQMSLISDSTPDAGADRPITSAFAWWYDISEISPDTTDPWTPTEFNDVVGEIDRTV